MAGQFNERGILTDEDIAFLKGKKTDITSAEKSRTRQRIRERVAAAMADFEILAEHWPTDQQSQTLDLIEDQGKKSIEDAGADMIAFLYRFMNAENTQPGIVLDEDPVENLLRFRSSLVRGIRRGKEKSGRAPGVVSIATTTPLYETPTPDKVRDEISSSTLTDLLRKMNEKYRRSGLYEDDELVVEDHEAALRSLYLEWEELVTAEIVERRMKADDFSRPPGTPITNVQGYRDEFDKDADS